jgi:hypothetical protein
VEFTASCGNRFRRLKSSDLKACIISTGNPQATPKCGNGTTYGLEAGETMKRVAAIAEKKGFPCTITPAEVNPEGYQADLKRLGAK